MYSTYQFGFLTIDTCFCLFPSDEPMYTADSNTTYHAYNGTVVDKTYTLPLDSNPYPESFTWSHNEEVISNASERGIVLAANGITFGTVSSTDQGKYSVVATNLVGNATATFELIVYCELLKELNSNYPSH